MSTNTSLKITTASSGTTKSKTLTSINPSASDYELKVAAETLVGLTNNTYSKAERITTVNVDSAVNKSTPTFELFGNTAEQLTRTNCLAGVSAMFNYNGDGNIWVEQNNDNTSWCTTVVYKGESDPEANYRMYIGCINEATKDAATAPHDIIIRTEETDNFKAGEFVVHILEDS